MATLRVMVSTKTSSLPKSSERPTSWSKVPTFKSGMWNLKFSHNPFCLLVTLFMVSHVCWHVLSPGADINQYSLMMFNYFRCKLENLKFQWGQLFFFARHVMVTGDWRWWWFALVFRYFRSFQRVDRSLLGRKGFSWRIKEGKLLDETKTNGSKVKIFTIFNLMIHAALFHHSINHSTIL